MRGSEVLLWWTEKPSFDKTCVVFFLFGPSARLVPQHWSFQAPVPVLTWQANSSPVFLPATLVNWWVILLVLDSKELLIMLAFHLLWQKEKIGRCSTPASFPQRRGEAGSGRGVTCCGRQKLPGCVMLFTETQIRRGEGEGKSLC